MDTGTVWDQSMQPMHRVLIDAAQQEILERGYRGTSLRGVARRSGVDPSLVRHYFGSKDELLLQAVQVRVDPVQFAKEILRGAPGAVGRRIVRFMLGFWEESTSPKSLVRLVSTLNSPKVAELTKDAFIEPFFGTVAAAVSPDRPQLRAALAASQMMTLGFSRYVLREPTLSRTGRQDLVRIVGRCLQHCLTGPLPATKDDRGSAATAAETGEDHGQSVSVAP